MDGLGDIHHLRPNARRVFRLGPAAGVTGPQSYSRYHIAVIDPAGTAQYVWQAITIQQAARVAERRIRQHLL